MFCNCSSRLRSSPGLNLYSQVRPFHHETPAMNRSAHAATTGATMTPEDERVSGADADGEAQISPRGHLCDTVHVFVGQKTVT